MDWKDSLDKKAEELKIKKEESNEAKSVSKDRSIGSRSNNSVSSSKDSPHSSNTIGSGSSSIFRGRIPEKTRQINNVKEREEKFMIPSKGLFDDYNAIDKESIGAAEKVWKYLPKLIKVVLNCRTNTVKIMDAMKIPRDEGKKEAPKTE